MTLPAATRGDPNAPSGAPHAPSGGVIPTLVLALGVFGIITTEIGVIGVLPQLAERTGVSPATAGWFVSVFALVVALTGPISTLLIAKYPPKNVLLVAIAVFAVANLVSAFAVSFPVLMIFRVLPALVHPVFFAVALTSAGKLVPPARAAGAVTRVFAGVTVGFAFGVPLMAFFAERFSLGAAFGFGALVNALAFIGIALFLPVLPATEVRGPGAQLGILRRPTLWLNLVGTVLLFAAMFSGYSYFAELLRGSAGVPATAVSGLLLVFGVVMVAGNFLFGRMAGTRLRATALLYPLLVAAVFAGFALLGPVGAGVVVFVAVWGVVHSGGLVVSQVWLGMDTRDAPTFGNSLFVSFTNLGITLGAWSGGLALSGAGLPAVPWLGAGLALASFAFVLARVLSRRN